MKVEIDTINKTIKVLDECTLEEFLEFVLGLDGDIDYKLLPNTIINTIKIRENKPLEWVQPWTINPQPYTPPFNPYIVKYDGTGVITFTN